MSGKPGARGQRPDSNPGGPETRETWATRRFAEGPEQSKWSGSRAYFYRETGPVRGKSQEWQWPPEGAVERQRPAASLKRLRKKSNR